jgi:hypothetical protein
LGGAIHERERDRYEITFWDNQAVRLQTLERQGRSHARLNAAMARRRCDELQGRLRTRLAELDLEQQITARPPTVVGGCLVIPGGLLRRLQGADDVTGLELRNKTVELLAMHAVCAAEQAASRRVTPVYRTASYDVESQDAADAPLHIIEVKGYRAGSTTVSLTRNEMLTALNKCEAWRLGLVAVPDEIPYTGDELERRLLAGHYLPAAVTGCRLCWVPLFFAQQPEFYEHSRACEVDVLWQMGYPA